MDTVYLNNICLFFFVLSNEKIKLQFWPYLLE